MVDYLGLLGFALLIIVIMGLVLYGSYKQQQSEMQEPFFAKSMYEILEEEEAEKNRRNLENARKKDVIENNPWIMIDPVTKNATLYPRSLLDNLSGSKSGEKLITRNKSYYDFSDVVYTGLPL